MVKAKFFSPLHLFTLSLFLVSCSMTKNIPADDQLFTGLKKIQYVEEPKDSFATHLENTKLELEAALATEPNGSVFGSSYYSVPWSWHLWVFNHFAKKEGKFSKWMTKSFGKPPVLMSQVNPTLRASVAKSVLRNNGYFQGDVGFEIVPQKNPRKNKIRYSVRLAPPFTLDSVAYVNFPDAIQQLIDSTSQESLIKKGNVFSIGALDGERSRISALLRNNGYYYYNPSYASYLADTLAVANKAQLRFQLAEGVPEEALHKWYIGHIDVQFRKTMREQLTDSLTRRNSTIHFSGKRPPIRPNVVLRNLRLRSRQPYSYEKHMESASKINATGVFSTTDFQFTPRPGTDSLDLSLNCVFDKPYDVYIETNLLGRTSGRYGPEVKVGFTRLNAFRGGEKLDINLHGAYEWQTSGGSDMSSYQYGADASIEFPRIVAPFYNNEPRRRDSNGRPRRRRFFAPPTTYAKVSMDVIRRPRYYKMHIVAGEWTYRLQPSATSRHEFSPLTVKYQYMNSHTALFDSIRQINSYLLATMDDYFIPKMRYTYTYTSPSNLRHPIRWETTVEESGNLVSLWDLMAGHSFNEKQKTLFKTPYSQFVRFETDLTKTWNLTSSSQLVGHLNAGILFAYGNSEDAPFSESFYAGGANSIRAFSMRGIGPGGFDGSLTNREGAYLMQNGDMKFVANLEYRTNLFGSLNGAIFLDAGNVWFRQEQNFSVNGSVDPAVIALSELFKYLYRDTKFEFKNLLKQTALGTGIGLRYDLGFLVIRLDWGIAIHCPYDTGKSGYFNVKKFKDAQTLHFAVGYPF